MKLRGFISAGVVLSLVVMGVGCLMGRRFPALSSFRDPPYEEVALGVALPEPAGEWDWPHFVAGGSVAYYSYGDTGQIERACCSTASVFRLSQPAGDMTQDVQCAGSVMAVARMEVELSNTLAGASMESRCAAETVMVYTAAGHVESLKAEVTLSASTVTGGLRTLSGMTEMAAVQAGGGLRVSEARAEMVGGRETGFLAPVVENKTLVRLEEGGQLASAVEERMAPRNVTAGTNVVFTRETTAMEQHSVQEATAPITRMDLTMTASNAMQSVALRRLDERGEVQREDRSGYFGSMADEDTFLALEDEDEMELIEDSDLLEGCYDEEGMLAGTEALVVPPEETAALLAAIKARNMRDVMERPLSLGLRPPPGQTTSNGTVTLRLAEVRGTRYWHGHEVLFSLSVKNTGTTPLYDLCLFQFIPDNAAFARFPTATPGNGCARFHLEDDRALFWKLYLPLKPGQTFRVTFAVRLDPWIARDAETKPWGRASVLSLK